jgi:uncharacterized protein (DUF1697 family)
MLRAVNLAGRNRVGMEALRDLFTRLGHANVRTYVQSGNVVFRSRIESGTDLCRNLEEALSDELGFTVRVLLRTSRQLRAVATSNPFLAEGEDTSRLHVVFLSGRPGREAVEALGQVGMGNDRFVVAGREVFLDLPNGYARTKLSNDLIERRLAVTATTRNWRTVTKLVELAST